jgi:hypothetical protein
VCAFVEQETMLENATKIVSPDYGTSSKAMEVVSNQFLEHNFTCQCHSAGRAGQYPGMVLQANKTIFVATEVYCCCVLLACSLGM